MNKVVGVSALVFVAVAGVLWSQKDHEDRATTVPVPVVITYHVTGTADGVDITVETPTGTQQAEQRAVPLGPDGDSGAGMTVSGFMPGDFVYISAQNTGEDGTVTCSIVDSYGLTISENTSTGAYAIATCDGVAN